jgi:glycosyltransferase involved in cell wall biosynthesis
MNADKKVLILVPASTARGGITNYYQALKGEFSKSVEYFERGARTWPYRKGFFHELVRALKDYQAFKRRLAGKDVALVQTTTSLGLNAILRDGLFIRHAKRRGLKAVVFFRGWDDSAVEQVDRRLLWLFRGLFFCADRIITLSQKARRDLARWGYQREINVETTVVDKHLVMNVTEESIERKVTSRNERYRLLFLSRLEQRKGIYELLNAYQLLLNAPDWNDKLCLTICGDGFETEQIQKKIQRESLPNIAFEGFVSGQRKKSVFENADLFVFPSHGEGMPNAVLEAMAFGLPVITTPVGGLVDFFVPGENGFFIAFRNPVDLAAKIGTLLQDGDRMLSMGLNNYRLAKRLFRSDRVAHRMETIFSQIMAG